MTVISLHGELRNLREGICTSCKRKFVPGNHVSSQAVKPALIPSSLCQISVKSSVGPNSTFSWRRLLKQRASDHIPSSYGPHKLETLKESGNISQTSSSPPVAVTQKPVPSVPRWFSKRDPTANPALDVKFVREFIQKDPVRFVRFSPDGKHLAAVVTAADFKNGVIFIYNVETGDKTW